MLAGDARYRDYFITPNESDDLSQVVRPRALPLLTAYQAAGGERKIWTTFSADQVDLNYANPAVLLEIIDVLLFYVSKGAEFIRLDAIAYLWKQSGTSCINLPQAHAIIQLFRAVLDEVAPHVLLITETNVPPILAMAPMKRRWSTTSHCRRWFYTRFKPAQQRLFPIGQRLLNCRQKK
jgi:sucrose phosphorylase